MTRTGDDSLSYTGLLRRSHPEASGRLVRADLPARSASSDLDLATLGYTTGHRIKLLLAHGLRARCGQRWCLRCGGPHQRDLGCFTVATPAPGLPNTGAPQPQSSPQPEPQLAAAIPMVPILLLAVSWRRSRTLTMLFIAGLVAGLSPSLPAPSHSLGVTPAAESPHLDSTLLRDRPVTAPGIAPLTVKPSQPQGRRLVIASIGVDAQIEPVGLDARHTMAAPSNLDTVGWFSRGPVPGQPGDAVIDGHYGLPSTPAVFRNLDRLQPGDTFQVIWPDGHRLWFRIETAAILSASSPTPPDVFTRSGPARLSLITCAGQWEQSQRTTTSA